MLSTLWKTSKPQFENLILLLLIFINKYNYLSIIINYTISLYREKS